MQTHERLFVGALTQIIDRAKEDPQAVRQYYKSADPEIQEALRKALEVFYRLQPDLSHIADLLSTFLPNANKDSNVLFLASGEGHELVEAREVFPTGKFMAADLDQSAASVSAEIISDTEFFPLDLSKMKPEEVFRATGYKPDLVVCRHPHVTRDKWWSGKLLEWSRALRKIESTMLITNYFLEEAMIVNMELEIDGFRTQKGRYDKGFFTGN